MCSMREFGIFARSVGVKLLLNCSSDIVLLIDRLYCIDLFSCIAASLFNKLTYLLTYFYLLLHGCILRRSSPSSRVRIVLLDIEGGTRSISQSSSEHRKASGSDGGREIHRAKPLASPRRRENWSETGLTRWREGSEWVSEWVRTEVLYRSGRESDRLVIRDTSLIRQNGSNADWPKTGARSSRLLEKISRKSYDEYDRTYDRRLWKTVRLETLGSVSKINFRKSQENLANSCVLKLRQSYDELRKNLGRT